MTKILALNGVHSAGKSTIGDELEQKEGFNYQPEIAQKIIDEKGEDWGNEGSHEFQAAIFGEEVKRDQELFNNGEELAVVETWHFGSLAHSMETAEQTLVDEQNNYLEMLKNSSEVEMYAVFLDIPLQDIWERSPHFEEGDEEIIDFYENVRENHFTIYDEHEIDFEVVPNNGELDETYEEVQEFAYEVLEE